MIGNDVTITVLGVKGNQVRVGINAPKNVAVHREEIYERIKNEQAIINCPVCKGTVDPNCPEHGDGRGNRAAHTARFSGAVQNDSNTPKSKTLSRAK